MIVKVKVRAAGVTYDECRQALAEKVKDWKNRGFTCTSDLNVDQKTYRGQWRFVGDVTFARNEASL